MSIGFLLDENCRGPLWSAIQSHNSRGVHIIDAVRVGDLPDLPLRCPDPAILVWAERAGRILLTYDEKTMPGYWLAHIQSGAHSPGIFIVRQTDPFPEIIEALAIVAYASNPGEWSNRLEYFP